MVVKSKLLFSLLFVASCAIAEEKTMNDYMKMSLQELKEAYKIADNAHEETSEYKASELADKKLVKIEGELCLAGINLVWSGDELDYQQKTEKYVEAMRNWLEAKRERCLADAAELNTETIKKTSDLRIHLLAKRNGNS